MKKKLKLKKSAIIGAYLIAFSLTGMGAFFISQNMKAESGKEENLEYVNSSIVNQEDVEVINEETKMIKPYTNEKVQIAKYFYDYQADNETQEKSILYHENTYIQNSGMDFTLEEAFEVIAVLDGTVVDVKEDELLGKVVEIKHDNDLITSYQSLGEVSVKKNDTVKQGQVIGKSGTNTLDKDLGNHLHFELYQSGQVVNPQKFFDQPITKSDTTKKEEQQENTTNDQSQNDASKKTE